MILFLDTTGDIYTLALATREGSIVREKKFVRDERVGDMVFRAVCALLQKKKLTGVVVVTGPGRFSGIRHGVSIANTLAFAWGIRAVGVKKNLNENAATIIARGLSLLAYVRPMTFVLPLYDREPSITV